MLIVFHHQEQSTMVLKTARFLATLTFVITVWGRGTGATPSGLFAGLEKSLVSISHGGPLVEIDCKYGARTLCAAGGPSYCPSRWLNNTNIGRCGIASVSHFVTSGNLAGTCCYTYDDSLPPFNVPKPMSSVAAAFGSPSKSEQQLLQPLSTATLAPQNGNPFRPDFYPPPATANRAGSLETDALLSKPHRNAIVLQPGDPKYAAFVASLTNMPQFQEILSQGSGAIGLNQGRIFAPFLQSLPITTTTTSTTPSPEQQVEISVEQQLQATPNNPFSFLTSFINPSSLSSLFGLRPTTSSKPSIFTTTVAPLNNILQQSMKREDAYKELQQLLAQQIAASREKAAARTGTSYHLPDNRASQPFPATIQEQLIAQNNALKMEKEKLEAQLREQQEQLQARRSQVYPVTSPQPLNDPDTSQQVSYKYLPQRQVEVQNRRKAAEQSKSDASHIQIAIQTQQSPAALALKIDAPQQKDVSHQKQERPKCDIPKHFYRVARAQQRVTDDLSTSPFREARIAGGQFSQAGEVCWAAALLDNGNYFAGGVLVDERYVLTAAHEVSSRKAQQLLVRLGDTNLKGGDSSDSCAQVFNVRRIVISPVFDASSLAGDLALLELEAPGAELNPDCVCTACLRPTLPAEGEWCVVAGYGSTKAVNPAGTKSEREAAFRSNANSEQLKHVPLPVVSNEVCQRALRNEQIAPVMPIPFGVLDNTQLCAGGIGDQDACYGDGGSPLACFDRDSFYVAGVVSYGRGCAEKMLPGVYASVPAQLEWITGVIEETRRRAG